MRQVCGRKSVHKFCATVALKSSGLQVQQTWSLYHGAPKSLPVRFQASLNIRLCEYGLLVAWFSDWAFGDPIVSKIKNCFSSSIFENRKRKVRNTCFLTKYLRHKSAEAEDDRQPLALPLLYNWRRGHMCLSRQLSTELPLACVVDAFWFYSNWVLFDFLTFQTPSFDISCLDQRTVQLPLLQCRREWAIAGSNDVFTRLQYSFYRIASKSCHIFSTIYREVTINSQKAASFCKN